MAEKINKDSVHFKDMIIEIVGDGEIGDVMSDTYKECICKPRSAPDAMCPEHGGQGRGDGMRQFSRSVSGYGTDISHRDCPKHGLCSCKNKQKPNEKCPQHGTCVCDDGGVPKADCPDHGLCMCKYSGKTDFGCSTHGKCICENVQRPNTWCPEHGICLCLDQTSEDADCPRHGACTCLTGTKQDCAVHKNCNCTEDEPNLSCPEHGECVCTEIPSAKCPYHGRCVCGDPKKFDPHCSKHGRCVCRHNTPASNCPEHGQCMCEGRASIDRLCPKHGACTCALIDVRNYPSSVKSCICLNKGINANCPAHGLIISSGQYCPRYGSDIHEPSMYDRNTSYSVQEKAGLSNIIYNLSPCCKCIVDHVCSMSPCCKCIVDHVCSMSPCCRTLLGESKAEDTRGSKFSRTSDDKDIQKGTESFFTGTVEINTKHFKKICGFAMDFQCDRVDKEV